MTVMCALARVYTDIYIIRPSSRRKSDTKDPSQSRIFKKPIFSWIDTLKYENKFSKGFCQILIIIKVIYDQASDAQNALKPKLEPFGAQFEELKKIYLKIRIKNIIKHQNL